MTDEEYKMLDYLLKAFDSDDRLEIGPDEENLIAAGSENRTVILPGKRVFNIMINTDVLKEWEKSKGIK